MGQVTGWLTRHPGHPAALAEDHQVRPKAVLAPCPHLRAAAGQLRTIGELRPKRRGQDRPAAIAASAPRVCPA